jgi:hypothetical protein
MIVSFAFAHTIVLPKVVLNENTGDAPYTVASGLI